MLRQNLKQSSFPLLGARLLSTIIATAICLSGCASSSITRGSSSGVDKTVRGSQNFYDSATATTDPVIGYQNATQTTKGAILGGTAGAIAGAMSSKVGALSGAAMGAIVGASIGAYVDAHTTLEDRLENRGVMIVVLGDQILMIIPSNILFQPATATLKQEAYSTLNMVSKYINRYDKTLVKIAAYSNPLGPEDVNVSLTREQASSVETYLLETGMDSRVIYADGYGGTHLVERISDRWEAGDNYRVEITLEKLGAA